MRARTRTAGEAFIQDPDGAARRPAASDPLTLRRNTLSADGRKLVKPCVRDLVHPRPADRRGEAARRRERRRAALLGRRRPASLRSRAEAASGSGQPCRHRDRQANAVARAAATDGVGVTGIAEIAGTPDGSTYAYSVQPACRSCSSSKALRARPRPVFVRLPRVAMKAALPRAERDHLVDVSGSCSSAIRVSAVSSGRPARTRIRTPPSRHESGLR